MNTLKNTKHLALIAQETGISLYQRYSEEEAATVLNIGKDTLKMLRKTRKIGFLDLAGARIEYFGSHILQYLLSANRTVNDDRRKQKDSILRMAEVSKITGLSRTTIWRYEKDGLFPGRVSLGGGSIGWYKSEIYQWVVSRRRQKNFH